MRDPFIHRALEVKRTGNTKFGVFARDFIPRGTIVESCSLVAIPKVAISALEKVKSPLLEKLLPNPDGIRKEIEITESINEMELQRRLDAGLLTQEEAGKILLSSGVAKAVLDVETACFLTGFGSLYNRSSYPNITLTFDSESKLYNVVAVKDIVKGYELTYLST